MTVRLPRNPRTPLPSSPKTTLDVLLEGAPTNIPWGSSPFDLKDALKARSYSWNDDSDCAPRSWYVDVDEDKPETEWEFLHKAIYWRGADIHSRRLTVLEMFSGFS
jgi:DNA polymerase III subunit epsilon